MFPRQNALPRYKNRPPLLHSASVRGCEGDWGWELNGASVCSVAERFCRKRWDPGDEETTLMVKVGKWAASPSLLSAVADNWIFCFLSLGWAWSRENLVMQVGGSLPSLPRSILKDSLLCLISPAEIHLGKVEGLLLPA